MTTANSTQQSLRSGLIRAAITLALFGNAATISQGQPPSKPDSAAPPTAGFADEPRQPLLTAGAGNTFRFDTARIQGTISLDGAYHGVTRLVDKRTGKQVIDPRYAALNLFKLMSVNLVMGQPRNMPRSVRSASAWVEAIWPASEGHAGEVTARYALVRPDAVDLTVTVRSRGVYRGYELFLSSYFDKAMRPHVCLESARDREPQWVLPTASDVFRGTVLVFPRDSHSAGHCLDGRWERSEGQVPVVQMCPVRHYGRCLAVMADPGGKSGVVLMSRPRDCYAISTRYHAENDADRLTSYSAFDLSLFGSDFSPGDEQTVKVRLAVTDLDAGMSQPLELYRAFLAEAATGGDIRPSNAQGAKP
jgi:hypothetical protein